MAFRAHGLRPGPAGSSEPGEPTRRRTVVPGASGLDGLRDEDAVRAAYDRHGAELYRFAHRSLGDSGAAEDAVQETFLRAWRAAERFDPAMSSLRVWLFAIARNVVVDAVRRRDRRSWAGVHGDEKMIDERLEPVPDTSEEALTMWLVEDAVRRLSSEHQQVVVETYLRDRSYADVAAETGVPVGTLRSRCFYALKTLRNVLEEMGVMP